ncbi:MAG: D-serine deaminase-like pyridoxal phosphate-dependent protein [Candidatus Azotimanducaceae bacterium]|jgi:D-serine deaminase-like pyridoxal phosphate-dependent protein
MQRRALLFGSLGLTLAAGSGGAFLWRPEDIGAPHDRYFAGVNQLLKTSGPGRPVMMLDLDRVNHNIDQIVASVGPSKTFRIVVKSLPSLPLLRHVMARANTNALMVFHQPFINEIAQSIPQADVLIGKPMPVNAAATFYQKLIPGGFDPQTQLQWLIDSPERLAQYQKLARQLGVRLRINFELDVGLHRGGFLEPKAIEPMLAIIKADPEHLEFAGFMGYEPQLTGLKATLAHPAVQQVLNQYSGFIDQAKNSGFVVDGLTLNGAGSHTLGIYPKDKVMNDLSAGSAVVKPMDFDTYHLEANTPAMFIATPILKRYDDLMVPGDPTIAKLWPLWNPNMQRLYFIYGGAWKARVVSPAGVPEPIYQSTNQTPYTTSRKVDLDVDDYMFLRPTQSEHVMLQFGDLLIVKNTEIVDTWPVFQQTG